MRLDRVYINGFRNLKDVEVRFDETKLATVIIGQNGAGKSNFVEAIIDVFRFVDMNRGEPVFQYEIDYQIDSNQIRLTNLDGTPQIFTNGKKITRTHFEQNQTDYFPDLVFGYYSGVSRRLERLFDSHQRRYYDVIKTNDNEEECQEALQNRRLFYCRQIHGALALLSFFAFPDEDVSAILHDKLGITGFHSLLALFHQPWFSKSTRHSRLTDAYDLWGAKGPAGICARGIRDAALHPIALEDKLIDDYRDRGTSEAQFAGYLRDKKALREYASAYKDDREMFTALEATDISDLIRDIHLWVTKTNDNVGNVSFDDLSDGERQLLMVLGLIRVSRGKRALFLLDEPDTHLNPVWQRTYLELIRNWTGIVSEAQKCQIILTSHNPLTISALEKEEVRVMHINELGELKMTPPYTSPRGMGFTATLTEIFGLSTTLDSDTQSVIDRRNFLAGLSQPTQEESKEVIELNDKLDRLGFTFEDREPLYQDFLRAYRDVKYANRPPLTPDQLQSRHLAMQAIIKKLMQQ